LCSVFIKIKKKPSGEVYLLDSFLLKNSFDKGSKIKDRYYPGLIDNLPDEKKEKVWYFLTISGLRYPWEWFKFFFQASKSGDNLIFKEHWLKPRDYLFAIWKSIFLSRSIKAIPKWRGLNISRLVKDEIINDQGSNSVSQGILMYLSFKRFKKEKLEIIGVIDWFENQVIDRGLYLGMRNFFPKIPIKGYIGFIPENYYLGIFPTTYENQSYLIPSEMLVVGDVYAKSIKQFCPKLSVTIGPAFRFRHILNYVQNKNSVKNIILLALPMKMEEVQRIIILTFQLNLNSKYKLIIKAHPASNFKKIMHLLPNSTNIIFEFSDLPLIEIFQNTRLLMTTASSAALEAVACGIHVAIIGNFYSRPYFSLHKACN
jgi:hypothetical protein